MHCTKCGKYYEGYRCPYCGHFLLDDPSSKGKKNSVYHKQSEEENKKLWPVYIFLIVFVCAWIFVVCWAILHK